MYIFKRAGVTINLSRRLFSTKTIDYSRHDIQAWLLEIAAPTRSVLDSYSVSYNFSQISHDFFLLYLKRSQHIGYWLLTTPTISNWHPPTHWKTRWARHQFSIYQYSADLITLDMNVYTVTWFSTPVRSAKIEINPKLAKFMTVDSMMHRKQNAWPFCVLHFYHSFTWLSKYRKPHRSKMSWFTETDHKLYGQLIQTCSLASCLFRIWVSYRSFIHCKKAGRWRNLTSTYDVWGSNLAWKRTSTTFN